MFTPFTETFDRIAVEIKADVILDETLADDNLDEGLHLGQRLAIRAIERHENVKRHEHDCKQESSCSCAWPTTYVQAPTGSGKTMIMVVSAIIKSLKHQRSVILCPVSRHFFSRFLLTCFFCQHRTRIALKMLVRVSNPETDASRKWPNRVVSPNKNFECTCSWQFISSTPKDRFTKISAELPL